jgi:hypothetical protein
MLAEPKADRRVHLSTSTCTFGRTRSTYFSEGGEPPGEAPAVAPETQRDLFSGKRQRRMTGPSRESLGHDSRSRHSLPSCCIRCGEVEGPSLLRQQSDSYFAAIDLDRVPGMLLEAWSARHELPFV